MERRANLPPPQPPSIPIHTISADPNQTAAASSFSSPSISPPDFLRQFHAVFKRQRPLGTMQSNVSRASRVLVSHPESSKSTTTTKSSINGNNVGKRPSQAGAPVGAARLSNVVLDRRKGRVAEVATNPPEDSLLTPPFTGTITTVGDENMTPFGMQNGDAELVHNRNEVPLEVPSSGLPLNGNSSLDFQSSDARLTTDTRRDNISSYMRSLALTEGEGHLGSRPAMNGNDVNQGYLRTMEMSDSGMKFDGGASLLEKRGELGHIQLHVDPVTRSSVVGSSCATTISVHSGPTYHCTHAPLAGQTVSATQMSSSAAESSLDVQDRALPEGRGTVQKKGDGIRDNQQAPRMGEDVKEKGVSRDANGLRAQVTMTNNLASNVGLEPSQSSIAEKVPRKKKYDPDIFFKVNGKLYQKLGKIGSGGSSEVHKVISSDCTIYALKKIKLKGRDYPTAYGFCQEIEYLNRLKRRNNIIQLIDYEVTDKKLLEGGMNGSMSTKDGRIKDDQYIYMVLEYGEIDLAHMLSHKWMKMDSSSWKIDENWLRFYWQQMLEAVNTIHEERIVHSDLKPANFLLVRGSLKLIDFGIAKAILCDTTNIQRDAQVGTLNYMSPEAFMWNEQDASGNTIKCGRPSDIWSLGCILYQMVYGKTPFAEYKTFWAKFKVITDRKHEIAYEHVSNPWLIDLMRRCLAWDRSERWRIPQLLQHPFLVPPIPRGLRDFGGHPCESLMQRVGAYWDDPEVSRLCSELHEVVADLERRKDDPASAD